MSTQFIEGLKVEFPFQPYDVQKKFMEKVIQCLNQGIHAVLESPTGTGKTLSLLCSTLAWLKKANVEYESQNDISTQQEIELGENNELLDQAWGTKYWKKRVIYSSRTHSQLHKAMQELQNTAYKSVRVTMLGSRDQLCIHPVVSREMHLTTKNALCRMHVRAKSCYFVNQVEAVKKDPAIANGVTDIEDLVKFGRKKSCCPYYLARDLQDQADIIFMPYNYLFDIDIRKKLNIHLQDTILILDEGHNIDKICEEAVSFSLSGTEIAVALNDITKEMTDIYEESQVGDLVSRNYSADDLCYVKQCLLNFEESFDEVVIQSQESGNTYKGSFIFSLLEKAGINTETWRKFLSLLNSICEVIQYKEEGSSQRGAIVTKLVNVLTMLFSLDRKSIDIDFKIHFEKEQQKREIVWSDGTSKKNGKVLNFWCFNPGFGMSNLLQSKVHSLILTSGTLAPIDVTIKELGISNPLTLESPHVIESNQVSVVILDKGPNNIRLQNSFSNRDNAEYWNEVGLTLQNILRIIPDGVLVFFPSYTVLKKAVDSWKSSGLWHRLILIKPFFVEESSKQGFNLLLTSYKGSVDKGKGGVLIGVCRGKVSEGMDFSDSYGRAVLVFGLPYPPFYDPKIRLKKDYLNTNKLINKNLNGDLWYQLEATRAVNQAIGRVIRHIDDFGVIILCDMKFSQNNVINNLSKWIRPLVKNVKTFGESIFLLRHFFKNNKDRINVKQQNTQAHNLGASCSTSASNFPIEEKNKTYYLGPNPAVNDQNHCNIPGFVPTVHNGPLLSPIKETNKQTLSCLALLQQQNEEEDVPILEKPRSCFSLGSFNENVSQPAKRRKISVAPLLVGDIRVNSSNPVAIAKAKKLNEAKNFICEMKNTLEDESYAQFDMLIRNYQQSHDIQAFLEKLRILFPPEDTYFKEVFRDCQKLFSGHHLKTLQEYCQKYYA